jgi:hypothetical protein
MRRGNNFGVYRGFGERCVLTESQILRLIEPRRKDSLTNTMWPRFVEPHLESSETEEKPEPRMAAVSAA